MSGDPHGRGLDVPGEPQNWEGWEDSAVAPEKLGVYLRALKKLMDAYGYRCLMYGHFGDGCVHTAWTSMQSVEGIKKFRSLWRKPPTGRVLRWNSFGEHGDGQARAELLPKMFGPELVEAFSRFKSLWDPEWKMNSGQVDHPDRLDEDLRWVRVTGPGSRRLTSSSLTTTAVSPTPLCAALVLACAAVRKAA